jgi:hypothetical protein
MQEGRKSQRRNAASKCGRTEVKKEKYSEHMIRS